MEQSASFGYWLRRRRKALDLTQDELARQVGCALGTVKKLETDERRPSREMAARLADCLAIPDDDRAAFLKAARAELAVDRLAPPVFATPPAPQPRDRTPSQPAVKGYDLRDLLGAGGFGAVYRAIQPGIGREVAVKIIRPEYANQPDFIRRFEAEAQIVARLEHPAIVPLYDYWRESGGAYLVMRYVRGGNLQTALGSGPWSLEQAARLLEQIGAALAFAHRHGVVHRDLKPANILLDGDGNAYLADFGIAKDLGTANAVGETQPGAVVGSPVYLSPEQLRDESVTLRSDIYSLGVLLFEVLTGAQPFANLPPAERMYQQLHTPLPPLQRTRPDLPSPLDAIIQRATAKTPVDRYPDVLSLIVDWQRATTMDDRPPTTDPRRGTIDDLSSIVDHPSSDLDTSIDLAAIKNPYKGLRAFGEADAADFFGREALTQRLLERLAEPGVGDQGLGVGSDATSDRRTPNPQPSTPNPRFLAVVGPSGSGKSSVVRAGLIPALRRGGLEDSERWFVVELFPGAHPLEEIEAALLRIAVNPPESLLAQLREDERGLARAIKRVLPDDAATELVLVIDQFEELWTLTQDEDVRAHILTSLVAAINDPRGRVRVIVTLRADFIDRPLQYGAFGALLRERTEFVLPLAPDELAQAIAAPARRVGLALEPELVVAISDDVGAQPGALPLLQYALTELCERRAGPTLTLAAYRVSGGIRGALARRADALYNALDADGQAAARQLFLRLITLGEGVEDTRRRASRAELVGLTKDEQPTTNDHGQRAAPSSLVVGRSSTVDTVIDAYGRARLLAFDRDPITREPTVEVAHEALLRAWDRLRAWLDAGRADIRAQRQLAMATTEWSAAARDPSYLLAGARLAQFAAWAAQTDLALTPNERAFLDAGLAERVRQETAEYDRQQHELEIAQQLAATEQRRANEQHQAAARLRRRALFLAGALALALVAAIAAGVFASSNATLATQNANIAATAQGDFARSERLRLAGDAKAVIESDTSGDVAALLALRSLRYGYSYQADAGLLNALARGFVVQRFTDAIGTIFAVAFSPDGKYVLTGSFSTARLWDVQNGQEIRQFTGLGNLQSIAFSPDGKYALTGSVGGTMRLLDVQTGQEMRQFTGLGSVQSIAFSPDGKYILTAPDDGTARLLDVASGRQLRIFDSHAKAVTAVAFSPDGKYVLTASSDEIARLWDVATGQQARTFNGQAAAFAPDGKTVLTGSVDKAARLWDMATGRLIRLFIGHAGSLNDVAFSPDGKYMLTGSDDRTARLWDVTTGRTVRTFSGHLDAIRSVAFSPNGKYVLTGSNDGTVRLWDAQAGLEPRVFTSETNPIMSVVLSSDGKYILTGTAQKLTELWDVQTGAQLRTFAGDPGTVTSVAFSSDGRHALTLAYGQRALLWDAQTGEQLRTISGYTGYGAAAFAPDGTSLLTSSDDKTARMWDTATSQELRVLSGHAAPVTSVAFSSDGKLVLTGSDDKTARMWNAATGMAIRIFSGHTAKITGVAFSPDGKLVLTGSADRTARLWDAATGNQMRLFSGHANGLTGIAFAPDGKYILTGSADTTARLWDAATGQELRRYSGHTDALTAVAFAPDGSHVLTSSADRTARLWRTQVQDVIQLACSLLRRDLSAEERTTYSIADDAPTCPKP